MLKTVTYEILYWSKLRNGLTGILKLKTVKFIMEKVISDDDWFLLNPDQIGFYRVNYELSNWILLIHQLRSNHNAIPPIARLQILDDIIEFYSKGQILGAQTIFDVISYLENETEYTIWKYSKTIFDLLKSFFDMRPSYKYFKAFMNKMIGKLLYQIDWMKSDYRTLTIQLNERQIDAYLCVPIRPSLL
uniref:Aminopeptidase N-1 n=1 Tax=Schmidtea mediterranea TaxID=79327 RepID=I1ZIK9_SCHMD|nr:aminopeptidase N-1 [Schmidtea mediterranea]